MLRAISLRESWMREIRTSGLTRERAPNGPSLLYNSSSSSVFDGCRPKAVRTEIKRLEDGTRRDGICPHLKASRSRTRTSTIILGASMALPRGEKRRAHCGLATSHQPLATSHQPLFTAPLLRRRAMVPPDSLATDAPVQQPRRLAVCQVGKRYTSFPVSRPGCRSDGVLWLPESGVRQENRTASRRDELRPNEPSEDGPIRSPG